MRLWRQVVSVFPFPDRWIVAVANMCPGRHCVATSWAFEFLWVVQVAFRLPLHGPRVAGLPALLGCRNPEL